MAVALFKALSAIGLKAIALVQSLFFFPAGIFRQALALLSSPGSKPNPPTLLCPPSSSEPSAPIPSATPSATSSTSSVPASPEIQKFDANTTDLDDMAAGPSPSSSGGPAPLKKAPVPNIVPALPRIAPISNKENAPISKAPDTSADVQFTNELAALSLKENGTSTTATSVPSVSSGNVTANSEAAVATTTENGVAKDDVLTTPRDALSAIASIGSSLATQEVTRAPPVPLLSAVSQTSKLKETATIKVGEENLQVLPKEETPEQAAERAMHSGFMREALDMVSRFGLVYEPSRWTLSPRRVGCICNILGQSTHPSRSVPTAGGPEPQIQGSGFVVLTRRLSHYTGPSLALLHCRQLPWDLNGVKLAP